MAKNENENIFFQIPDLTGSGKRAAEAILQITELISGRLTLLLSRGQNETLKLSPLEDTFVHLFHQTLKVKK